jgi:hypothetical protein
VEESHRVLMFYRDIFLLLLNKSSKITLIIAGIEVQDGNLNLTPPKYEAMMLNT